MSREQSGDRRAAAQCGHLGASVRRRQCTPRLPMARCASDADAPRRHPAARRRPVAGAPPAARRRSSTVGRALAHVATPARRLGGQSPADRACLPKRRLGRPEASPAKAVAAVLTRLVAARGRPGRIVGDYAPAFISRALAVRVAEYGVPLHHIQPGKPNQNAFVESVNSRVRDECLNQHWFLGGSPPGRICGIIHQHGSPHPIAHIIVGPEMGGTPEPSIRIAKRGRLLCHNGR